MKVLVVVDMQNDFIDGALGTPEAQMIVTSVAQKLEQHRKAGSCIVFTRDTHQNDYLDTQEGRNLPVTHCIENSKGWEISAKLDTTGCTILNKPSFGSTQIADVVRNLTHNQIDGIELVGLCTDICVISNAMILKAEFPEVLIQVDASCCAGVTVQTHVNALEAMKMCQITIV